MEIERELEERDRSQEDYAEDDHNSYIPIEELQHHGINMADIKKFKEAGVHTVSGVLMMPRKELLNIKGISEAKVLKFIEAAQKTCPGLGFISGLEILQKRSEVIKLTTGSKALDELLGGGIESMSITGKSTPFQ
jgi:hypothetical protein